MAQDEETVWPPPPEGPPERAQRAAKPVNRALGLTAFCLSGFGALACIIIGRVDVYSVSQGGWFVLTFGGLASLLGGLSTGLIAWRSLWGKAGILVSLLTFA